MTARTPSQASSDDSHRDRTRDPDRVEAAEAAGRAAFPSFALRVVARTSSTQDLALAAARSGAPQGWCCVAAEQTSGRGRLGRAWVAPPGTALLTSIVLRPSPGALPGVTLTAGLAVADAVAAAAGVETRLKWPNDVLAPGGKLAGILAELEPAARGGPAVALGVGLNLAVTEFPPGVPGVSLHTLTADAPGRWTLLAALLRVLARRLAVLETAGLAGLLPDWRSRAAGLGGRVRARAHDGTIVEGIARDVAADGSLVVDTDRGPVRLLAADVELLDPSD